MRLGALAIFGLVGLGPAAWARAGSERCLGLSGDGPAGQVCLVKGGPDAGGASGLRLEYRPAGRGKPAVHTLELGPGERLDERPDGRWLGTVGLGDGVLVWVPLKRARPGADGAAEDECIMRFFRFVTARKLWQDVSERWVCRRPCSMQFGSYQASQTPRGPRDILLFHECSVEGQYLKSTYAWETGRLRPLEIVEPRGRDALQRGHAVPPLVAVCERTEAVRRALEKKTGKACGAIGPEALDGVTRLDLHRQGVERLASGDFSGLGELTYLDLGDNPLEELPEGVFDGLFKLSSLSFQGCRLRTLPGKRFAHLGSLRDLYLNHNQLESLAPDAFVGLSALDFLTLDHNRLRALPAGVFDPLPRTCRVYKNGNPWRE
jgi:hypothetical protein